MLATTQLPPLAAVYQPPAPSRPANPFVSDQVLLGLSVWWVSNTRPFTDDPATEIGAVFRSLQRDLQ
jgi:hypothetical protein